MNPDIVFKYFPELDERQRDQILQLGDLYFDLNSKINVISRKDIDNLYENHVLHSLAIARFLGKLNADTSILDIGTGGGFPGIPLAVYYPDCTFHLIDRIGKKLKVASTVSDTIGLDNITYQHGDIKECKGKFDYVVSRAVMPLNDLVSLIRKNVKSRANAVPGNKYGCGLVCLKGGDLNEESKGINAPVITYPLSEFIDEKHFKEKFIVYVPLC